MDAEQRHIIRPRQSSERGGCHFRIGNDAESSHISWTAEEVMRNSILLWLQFTSMRKIWNPEDGSVDYVKGANIAGFMKVAQAMLEQGVI